MSGRGAFVDPKGVRWDTNDADFEGWMSKKSVWLKEWRRRYFILKGSKLFFGKSATVAPHGMIDLVDCVSVKSAETKARRRNALEVSTNEETYLMFTETEKEKDEWIGAVGRSIVKHSSMYVKDDDDSEEESDEEESDEN